MKTNYKQWTNKLKKKEKSKNKQTNRQNKQG